MFYCDEYGCEVNECRACGIKQAYERKNTLKGDDYMK